VETTFSKGFLGDRSSAYCVLNAAGEIVLEHTAEEKQWRLERNGHLNTPSSVPFRLILHWEFWTNVENWAVDADRRA
jgi:hypothetical protein